MPLCQRGSIAPFIKDEVEFYPHQIEGIRKLAYMKSFLLADDMGLGKTLQSLTVFAIDVYMGKANSAIVICPATLKGNWVEEIEMFTGFAHMELGRGETATGRPRALPPAERRAQLKRFAEIEEPKILVVNYEQVMSHLEELKGLNFDVSIFDEAHYLKNPKAKRTKACMELYTRRSFLLTGSPLLNRVDELWPLLYRINPQEYSSYWGFRARYCIFGGYKNKEVIGVQNERELTNRLQSVMLRRLKDDVLSLKRPYYSRRFVDLSPLQEKMYEEVVNEMRLTLPHDLDGPMDIANGLTKLLRLKQICGTTATLIEEDESNKLDLAIEDALEIMEGGNKIIVFTQFRKVQESYVNRIKKASPSTPVWELHGNIPIPNRQPTVRQWSGHEGPAVIVCMTQVAGVGLNMTAARHIQFIDKLFVPKLNQQAVDRAHRIGQDTTQTVQVLEYIARGTVEKRIEDILKTKTKLFDDVVETSSWKKMLIEAALNGE